MSAKTASVFVVEDEALVADFLTHCLADAGYRVLGSTGFGEQAVESIPALKPDLVLMDLRLAGDLDGIGAALALRSRCDIPVIFLTGSHESATRNRACVAAPYGFVTKPIRRASVIASVEAALARKRAERNERWEPPPPALDDVTGLPSWQCFLDRLVAPPDRSAHPGGSAAASVCLCDLDHFRTLNDRLGREVGNGLLRRFASLLRASGSELLCRMEGDRFCIAFPELGLAETAARLDDIRLAFAEECLAKEYLASLPVTASFGIAPIKSGPDGIAQCDVETALYEAGRRLNDSKQKGGNRVSATEDNSTSDLMALYGLLGVAEAAPVTSPCP